MNLLRSNLFSTPKPSPNFDKLTSKMATQSSPSKLLIPAPKYGKFITILSIDGGGIRGIIPGVLLDYLESQLQEVDNNKNARLADYFDVISGTSTGGLITAMLSAPDKENGRPLYAANQIVKFYFEHSPKIFPQSRGIIKKIKHLFGPKYDGKYLHEKVKGLLGETRLNQTLTNVVIPTFDIKKLQPTIFSTYQVPTCSALNARLSDICIGTSAAPTYLPSYYFENNEENGVHNEENGIPEKFNLIDGGVTANNPTLVSIAEISKQITKNNPCFDSLKSMDYTRFLVISLGTGSNKTEEKYNAKMAAGWGPLSWIYKNGSTPIIDVFSESSSDMVSYHCCVLFKAFQSEKNHLRIDDDTLKGDLASVDKATDENLKNLEEVGKKLLKKTMTYLNMETGHYEPVQNGQTNEDELKRFAKLLSEERKLREDTAKAAAK